MDNSITTARKNLGLTQQQLAETVGVSRQTIISLEKGRFNPSLALAHEIKKALNKRHIEDVFHLEERLELEDAQPQAVILATSKLQHLAREN